MDIYVVQLKPFNATEGCNNRLLLTLCFNWKNCWTVLLGRFKAENRSLIYYYNQ